MFNPSVKTFFDVLLELTALDFDKAAILSTFISCHHQLLCIAAPCVTVLHTILHPLLEITMF